METPANELNTPTNKYFDNHNFLKKSYVYRNTETNEYIIVRPNGYFDKCFIYTTKSISNDFRLNLVMMKQSIAIIRNDNDNVWSHSKRAKIFKNTVPVLI